MEDAGLVGELVGHYRVVSLIGRGSAGEVYVAEHDVIGTRVAIKALHAHISANPDHVRRFFNEAIAASRIRHAGTVKIFDAGWLPCDRAYLVMELLEGETLRCRIERVGQLPLAELSEIARQTANVLAATHRVGIVHRDLKPDNVMLVPDSELGSGERVKILDFGIAKVADTEVTENGFMGTPDYMPPEQWHDSRLVDGRADAYSLGCVAFEMATGRVPFPSASIGAACRKHLTVSPPSVRELAPELPEEVDALISGLLRKRAEDRPSMQEIEHAFSTLTAAPPREPSARTSPASIARVSAAIAAMLFCVVFVLRALADQDTPVSKPAIQTPPAATAPSVFAVAAPHPTQRSAGLRVQARARRPVPVLRVAARGPSIARGRVLAAAPHPIDPYADTPSEPQPIDPYADATR